VTSEHNQALSLHSVGRSALIMTGGAAAVQVLAILRELFLAAQVGASAELDALLIALVLPTALPGVLTSGVTTALVPAYLEAREAGGVREARRLAGTIVFWVAVAGAAIWLALTVFAGLAVAFTGPGLSASGRTEAIGFLQLMAPIVVLTAVSAILFAVCQAEQRFFLMTVAGFSGQAASLATMLLLWSALGLRAFAIGALVGQVVVLTALLGSLGRWSLLPIPVIRSGGRLGPFVRHAAPLTFGAAILQLNLVADRAVASLLGPGAVSVLRYADVLVRAPVGAIAPAWGSAIYPALVRSTLAGAADSLGLDTQRALRYATAVFAPVAMLTAAVAPAAVMVAYGRGAFGADAIGLTSQAVAAFAPFILMLMISPILTGAHNARRRGNVLLIGAAMNVTLNFVLDIVLGLSFGVIGVALSSSISSGLVLAYFVRRMTISEPVFAVNAVARTLGLAVLASTPATLVIGLACWSGLFSTNVWTALGSLIASAVIGALGYLLVSRRLGMEEPRQAAALILGALRVTRVLGRLG
jgi:putative peptidoglycan lipid II flippase